MAYRLKNGIYSVRCHYPHCSFNERLHIDCIIMGMTEADVESEALNMARGMAMVKHDSLHARHHDLKNPEIHKVSGYYQHLMANVG